MENWKRRKSGKSQSIFKVQPTLLLQVLGIQIHDFQMPDVNAIGEILSLAYLSLITKRWLHVSANSKDANQSGPSCSKLR